MDVNIYIYSIMLAVIVGLVLTVLYLSNKADDFEDEADALFEINQILVEQNLKQKRHLLILEAVASSKLSEWIAVNITPEASVDSPIPFVPTEKDDRVYTD